jgi:hypothetical protein
MVTKKLLGVLFFSSVCTHVLAGTDLYMEQAGVMDSVLSNQSPQFAIKFGKGLVSADFNGDGKSDLAVGAPRESSPRGIELAGNVVVYMSADLSSLGAEDFAANATHTIIAGTGVGESLGSSLAAGDLNGDGFSDLIINAPAELDSLDPNSPDQRIFVFYGAADFPKSQAMDSSRHADVTISHTRGDTVSNTWKTLDVCNMATGDINGDKYDDLVICDDTNNVFHVLFGNSSRWASAIDLKTNADMIITPPNYTDLFADNGIRGLAIGDLNADGIDDLALGISKETVGSLDQAGQVYIVYGKNNSNFSSSIALETDANMVISGGLKKDQIGGSLAIGDINGNGSADLLIGAPLSGWGISSTTGKGRVLAVYDIASKTSPLDLYYDANLTLTRAGGEIGEYTGDSLLASDINADGIADILIGAPGGERQNGSVHIVYGASNLATEIDLETQADISLITPKCPHNLCGSQMGGQLAVADLNNDGKSDLAVSAYEATGGGYSGGWVALLLDIANKGAPVINGSCSANDLSSCNTESACLSIGANWNGSACKSFITTLDLNNFVLSIPMVTASPLGSFSVSMTLDLATFQFVLDPNVQPASALVANPATLDLVTGNLYLPELLIGTDNYNANLQYQADSSPMRFSISNYQLN